MSKNGALLLEGPKGRGFWLKILRTFSDEEALKELKECEFLIACDVDNPLYGQKGAAYVYAPQKGRKWPHGKAT